LLSDGLVVNTNVIKASRYEAKARHSKAKALGCEAKPWASRPRPKIFALRPRPNNLGRKLQFDTAVH